MYRHVILLRTSLSVMWSTQVFFRILLQTHILNAIICFSLAFKIIHLLVLSTYFIVCYVVSRRNFQDFSANLHPECIILFLLSIRDYPTPHSVRENRVEVAVYYSLFQKPTEICFVISLPKAVSLQ